VDRIQTLLGLSSGEKAESFKRFARSVGPYLLLELLLPGGTVAAAALWFLRRKGCRRKWPSARTSGTALRVESTI